MITAAYGSLRATSQRGLCVPSIRSLFSVIRVVIISPCVPLLRTWGLFYLLPPVASLNQAIAVNETDSVVRQRTLTTRAKDENSLACRKKCLHNLTGSSRRRCNANVCSPHQKAAFFTQVFWGLSKDSEPTHPAVPWDPKALCICVH